MVKFYSSNYSYEYPFPAVSLAYFLRYPNPYSTHVLSTDVISRHYDHSTQRLYTTRLHLKQSRLPPAVMKLLPKNILSGGPGRAANGEAQNFILEESVIDAREGWMETETRNLAYTGVLSVIEKQRFVRPATSTGTTPATESGGAVVPSSSSSSSAEDFLTPARTDVETTVTFVSRLGQQKQGFFRRRNNTNNINNNNGATSAGGSGGSSGSANGGEDEEPKRGFLSSWSMGAMQRTIEATGMQRTRNALVKSKEGMNVVLERMRTGGLSAVLEGMRRDHELVIAATGGGGTAPPPTVSGLGHPGDSEGDGSRSTGDTGASKWRSIWKSGLEKERRMEDDVDE